MRLLRKAFVHQFRESFHRSGASSFGQCRPPGRYKASCLGNYYVVFVKFQVIDERFAQCRYKSQRPAAKKQRRGYRATVRKRYDRLYGHGMEYRGRDVLARDILGHEVLYVGFAEHPAARRYGIHLRRIHCQLAELLIRNAEQYGHLVDECPRAAGTVAVHAQVGSPLPLKEHHFGVLAPDVYHGGHLRMSVAHIVRSRYNLLDERDSATFANTHAYGAGYVDLYRFVAHYARYGAEKAGKAFPYLGLMALVALKNKTAVAGAEHNHFGCRRTYVYTYFILYHTDL